EQIRDEDRGPPPSTPPLLLSVIPGGFIKQLVRETEKEAKAARQRKESKASGKEEVSGGELHTAPGLPPRCSCPTWDAEHWCCALLPGSGDPKTHGETLVLKPTLAGPPGTASPASPLRSRLPTTAQDPRAPAEDMDQGPPE
ncbi:Unconventional myosin-XVIIIb, partial [Manacus vitellinus]